MLAEGGWSVYSKSDPRWRANGSAMVGMFSKPGGVDEAIERLKTTIGEEPPEDLEWSYMKY